MVFKSRISSPARGTGNPRFFMNRERPIGETLLFTDRLAPFGQCPEWSSGLNEDSSLEKSILAVNFFELWPACLGVSISRCRSLFFRTRPAVREAGITG